MREETNGGERRFIRLAAPRLAAALVFGIAWCPSVVAHAQETAPPPGVALSKHVIDDQHPEASIPSAEQAMKNPLEMGYLLMDMIGRAEAATARGDHAAAVRYYRALAKAVPERATAFSKLCQSYEALGNLAEARANCQKAMGKGGVAADDYARWVRLTLRKSEPLTAHEVDEVDSVLRHVDAELLASPQGKVLAVELACEVASKLEDEARLERCTKQLEEIAPNDPRTFTYKWALALQRRDFIEADSTLAAAREAGLPATALAEMEAKIANEREKSKAWPREAGSWAVSGALLALSLGYWLWSARRKQVLSSAS